MKVASMWVSLVAATFVGTCMMVDANVSGSCASIGHSNSCCRNIMDPEACRATDGMCLCSQDCHTFGECCSDVNCTKNPKTCAEVGIKTCCTDSPAHCKVHNSTHTVCSCAQSCRSANNCCPDIDNVCPPKTCTEAGKAPGCCRSGLVPKSCYVAGGGCYCDSQCVAFNDCCTDVPRECANTLLKSTKLLSTMERELMVARNQDFAGNRYRHYQRRDTMEVKRPAQRDRKEESD